MHAVCTSTSGADDATQPCGNKTHLKCSILSSCVVLTSKTCKSQTVRLHHGGAHAPVMSHHGKPARGSHPCRLFSLKTTTPPPPTPFLLPYEAAAANSPLLPSTQTKVRSVTPVAPPPSPCSLTYSGGLAEHKQWSLPEAPPAAPPLPRAPVSLGQ